MNIDTNQNVSISKVNQTLSKAARVGLAVASEEMEYDNLLKWIRRNRTN